MSENEQGGPPKPPGDDPGGPPPAKPPSDHGTSPPPPTTPPPPGPPPGEAASAAPPAGALPESETNAAMWAHLGGAIIAILCVCAPLAFIPPLIFFLTQKDKSRFVGFHALQALFLFGAVSVLNVLLGMGSLIGLFFLTVPIAVLINLGAGVYGGLTGMQASKGEWAEYVVIGQLARDQLKR